MEVVRHKDELVQRAATKSSLFVEDLKEEFGVWRVVEERALLPRIAGDEKCAILHAGAKAPIQKRRSSPRLKPGASTALPAFSFEEVEMRYATKLLRLEPGRCGGFLSATTT